MTYQQAMEKINSRLLFGMQPGLDRITALLDQLGNPHKTLRYVHVCGTNGKGTVCTLTASVLQESGYKVGKNISPYVLNFRERFQINGRMISEQELAAQMDVIWPAVERLDAQGVQVSEFELVTAVAFCWFAQEHCDIAVMEVGMGGLHDATNVIPTPEAVAVMSISLDHTAWLGDTVEQIAREKSGVIKEDGRVVLYPEQDPAVTGIIQEVCRQRHARLVIPSLSGITAAHETIDGTEFQIEGLTLRTPFLGEHQLKNAAVVFEMVKILRQRGYEISDRALAEGFAKAFIPARMEVISRRPLCLLDGGHNPGCAQALRDVLRRLVPGRKAAVIGMLADKDSAAALELIGPEFAQIITVAPNSPRALSAEDLARTAAQFCPDVSAAEDCAQALRLAGDRLGPEDALIVCGSFYLAGEIRDMLIERFAG